MELWIRNQNKTRLTMVNDLYLVHDENNACDYIGSNMVGHLAKYTTPGRALEVLDEIQHLIQPSMNFIVSQHIDFDNDDEGLIGCNILKEEPKIEKISDCIVYEMPKE